MAEQLAFKNVETGEITERNSLNGRIGFRFGGATFSVPRAEVELRYTDTAMLGWTIRFPVVPAALADMAPLLNALGSGEAEALNLPAGEHLEVTLSARPEVLARLSPALVKLDMLSDMLRAGDMALLDLGNYEHGGVVTVSTPETVEGN